MKTRALQRAGAIAALLLIGSVFLGPIFASADTFFGGMLIDSQRRLAVNCEVGCGVTVPPWAQSNPGYMRLTDKSNNTAVSVDSGYQGGSIDNRNFEATESLAYALQLSGNVKPILFSNNTQVLMVTTGGYGRTQLNSTNCSQLNTIVFRIWAAGTETQTLTLYTDSGCSTALWSGIPSSTPIRLDVNNNGNPIYYKFATAPAVNDWATTN